MKRGPRPGTPMPRPVVFAASLRVRCTLLQRQRWEAAAGKRGQTLAEWVREACNLACAFAGDGNIEKADF